MKGFDYWVVFLCGCIATNYAIFGTRGLHSTADYVACGAVGIVWGAIARALTRSSGE